MKSRHIKLPDPDFEMGVGGWGGGVQTLRKGGGLQNLMNCYTRRLLNGKIIHLNSAEKLCNKAYILHPKCRERSRSSRNIEFFRLLELEGSFFPRNALQAFRRLSKCCYPTCFQMFDLQFLVY